MPLSTALSFVAVGACWGCTTPFIKDGTSSKLNSDTQQQPTTHENNRLGKLFGPLRSLASVKAAIPFLLNQSGSTLFYFLLSSQDMSTAVPVCNALSLVFTAATAMAIGEKVNHPLRTVSGIVLVLMGLAVCVASKAQLWRLVP
ncbi:unnamed protein product [Ectocarpus sp. 12 AP-2014]